MNDIAPKPAPPAPSFRQVLASPALLLGCGFGSGLAPWAPGSAASLAAAAVWLLAADLPSLLAAAWVCAAALGGVWICGAASARLGGGDHRCIVWDEFAGCWIALALAPSGWGWALAGLALFRALDILKPWPIKWLDRNVGGGIGIMLDDVVAGIMAALCLQSVHLLA